MMTDKTDWTLSQLAEETGISARTIRYYISRGLLDGPETAGRTAAYNTGHRDRLVEIQRLQREGRMLAEIAQPSVHSELPAPQSWFVYDLVDGVMAQVRSDLPPWRMKRVREILGQCASKLSQDLENPADRAQRTEITPPADARIRHEEKPDDGDTV